MYFHASCILDINCTLVAAMTNGLGSYVKNHLSLIEVQQEQNQKTKKRKKNGIDSLINPEKIQELHSSDFLHAIRHWHK